MKLIPELYIQLIRFLAGLYDAKSAPRIVRAAGLDPALVNFDQSAINVWTEIVEQAENTSLVEALLEIVSGDFNNDTLRFFREKIQTKKAFVQEQATHRDSIPVAATATASNLLNCLVRVTRLNDMGSGNGCLIAPDGLILTASFIFQPGEQEVMVSHKTLGTVKGHILKSQPEDMTALVKLELPGPTGFLGFSNTPPAVPDISTLAGYDYEYMKPLMMNGRYLYQESGLLYYDFPYTGKGLGGAPIINDREEILGMFVTSKPGQNGKKLFGAVPTDVIQKILTLPL